MHICHPLTSNNPRIRPNVPRSPTLRFSCARHGRPSTGTIHSYHTDFNMMRLLLARFMMKGGRRSSSRRLSPPQPRPSNPRFRCALTRNGLISHAVPSPLMAPLLLLLLSCSHAGSLCDRPVVPVYLRGLRDTALRRATPASLLSVPDRILLQPRLPEAALAHSQSAMPSAVARGLQEGHGRGGR